MPTTTVSPIEGRVRSRMESEKTELGNKRNHHLNERDEAKSEHDQAVVAAHGALAAAITQDAPNMAAALTGAYKEATKQALRAITEAGKARALEAKIALLDTPEEFERRVAAASAIAADRKMSLREATIRTLAEHDPSGEGMHYRRLWDAINEMALVEVTGKTPAATLNAMLAVDAAKHAKGEPATFERTTASTFRLVDRDAALASLPPRETPAPAEPVAESTPEAPAENGDAPKPKRSRSRKPKADKPAETAAQASE